MLREVVQGIVINMATFFLNAILWEYISQLRPRLVRKGLYKMTARHPKRLPC